MAHTHLSGLGLVLILVFGCLLLALIAELYYLLWWKKQLISSNNNTNTIEEDYSNHTKEMFYLFCWDKPNSIITHQNSTTNTPNPVHNTHDPDLEMGLGNGKDLLLKALGEEGVEAELMRLHNLMGPPRFLFTIKEESKEDLESDDGKSKCGDRSRKGSRTRSLGDLIVALDSQTPFLSPIDDSGRDSYDGIRCINAGTITPSNSNNSSDEIRCISAGNNSMRFSPFKGTIPNDLDHYSNSSCNYSNPLFESSMEAELFRLRASPPPKFKFLRDAEEKLYRRLLEEAQRSGILHEGILDNSQSHPCSSSTTTTTTIDEAKDVSLMSSCSSHEGILDNSQSHPCSNTIQQHYASVSMAHANCEVRGSRMSSCSSQVLPLVSSPPPDVVSTSIEK